MNNPPAFPNEGFNGWGEPFQGMTLRDYFAAKAMQAFLSDPEWRQEMDFEDTTHAAYHMADAMLKAREA
jgi:hypothetical protein